MTTGATEAFRAARDFLLDHREDQPTAWRDFPRPEPTEFNWALDWFDVIARDNDATALWIVAEDGTDTKVSFAELARRSDRVAGWLRARGVRRGDRVLLVLGNRVELWEAMLAAMKLGAVIIPATTMLAPADLTDRVVRGGVAHVIADATVTPGFADVPGAWTRIAVGERVRGWSRFAEAHEVVEPFAPDGPTAADDPLLLYFTSGTTAQPKLVGHTQVSYPIGHLSTMYWLGLRPGDVHLNISSPGWAKHAWSNFFAPWNAGATILIVRQDRFAAQPLLDTMVRCGVTSFCAPPTVWRMLVQEDLGAWATSLREVIGAGEPLNPEVIEQVRAAWGLTIRDGFGQTETTAQIGNAPGQEVRPGSMGRPLPGYTVALVDPASGEVVTGAGAEGEICLELATRPLGLMTGYLDDPERTAESMRGGFYHTGDVGTRDEDGYITYVGRADDVFKASDYRISPFELESVLIEHDAVTEAAVVPSPDPVRLAVPKAYVVLAPGHEPNRETALSILRHARSVLSPYKRVRRIEFAELPKTISGKIRRVELRGRERELHDGDLTGRGTLEWFEEDFPELKGS
ncbi:AMP-binding protein [Streptomyces sp. SID3343]|uniref:AMP-binding protein n=1 Tax=Streptomyces sp. SID3343 TaxID=2690260 RepID=UPI00136F8DDB|nr:AMP-binding protein [Streptomyces sp. SID3343]MYW05273.1 AMP-binding protein [Streptomyces sp. SID3343]